MEHELLTAKEVMGYLRISKSTLYRLIRDGRLKRIRIGRRAVRYRRQDVLALVEGAQER